MQRTRTASLAHGPAKADALVQRSRIVAPLIAQRRLLGYLYADIGGAYGRFHEADRDLVGMLASQAAVALDNAQWSEGLEQKVAERTAELQASNVRLEQRANELAVINSIQQGVAAKLDFQGIVDMVGDKLRDVFATGDMSIRWWDDRANLRRGAASTTIDARGASFPRGRRGRLPEPTSRRRVLLTRRRWHASSATRDDAGAPFRQYGGAVVTGHRLVPCR